MTDAAHRRYWHVQRGSRIGDWHKLLPPVPRIAVGMGTCGRGNGAEGLYHAFAEADRSQRHAISFLPALAALARASRSRWSTCACPGRPLLILHRVQANDAGRILARPASRSDRPRTWSSARSRSGTTSPARIRYGTGYPEMPLWNDVPFFKGQKKIVLRNCGLINPDDIEEYIARRRISGALQSRSSMQTLRSSSSRSRRRSCAVAAAPDS